MAVTKSEDGKSVTVTRTIQQTTPEQRRLEIENFTLKSILSEIGGFLFKVHTRLEQGIFPADKSEVGAHIKSIMDVNQLVEQQLNPSGPASDSDPSETNPEPISPAN